MSKTNPEHYQPSRAGQEECLVALRNLLGHEGLTLFMMGNVVKYLYRATSPKRTPEERMADLGKAEEYTRLARREQERALWLSEDPFAEEGPRVEE